MQVKKTAIITISILFFFLFIRPAIFAQPKPTAAVLDLEAKEGISQKTSELLSDSLRSSLFKTSQYELVTRESMEAILKEQRFQLSGCTSQECVVKIGKLLGAQKVFTGTIGKVGATYTITLKLLDVETGRFERIEEDRCPRCEEDSLLDSIDNLAARITGTPETPTPRESARPLARGQKEITGKDGAQMVLIPAGEFLMGSPQSEGNPSDPQHKVFLDTYYIDKYEVTVAQYRKFCQEIGRTMPTQPEWSSDKHPVVNVSWADATAYAQYYGKLLPTEAEWEKACRAGSTTKYCFGDAEPELGDYAWYSGNSGGQAYFVGTKKPNALGLYDMHGNAWEWCSDWYAVDYYKNSPTNNPKGPVSGQSRVLRGGGWLLTAGDCRSAFRYWYDPAGRNGLDGFRCASAVDLEDETRAEAFLLLGLAYLKENKPNESLAALDSGLALNPRPELKDGLMKNKADLLLAKGNYQNAIPLYQQLRQTLPEKRGEILYGTAVCLQNLGRVPEAIPVYMEALMNLPADSPLAKEIRAALSQIKKK